MQPAFYDRPTLEVAHDLVGCTLRHGETAGIIVETEAYHMDEPACHAFVGLTARTAPLFGPPGRAYVYRSYGIHALFNAVTEGEGIGAAVLIRALVPVAGIDVMRRRRGRDRLEDLCSGPGKLAQALAIDVPMTGCDLATGPVVIGPRPPGWDVPEVVTGPRIGITKAVELPWRISAVGNRHVSRPWPRAGGGGGAPGDECPESQVRGQSPNF